MKKILLILIVISCVQLFAQEELSKFDVRFGIGKSLLGTGDMNTWCFENELNYRISNYFSSSASIAYASSNDGVYLSSSFIQGNVNIFWDTFSNNGKNVFRIGTGITFYNVTDVAKSRVPVDADGNRIPSLAYYSDRTSWGINIIFEDTYSITEKLLLGLKFISQPYNNGDINSGILLKFGVRI